jgi:hypothetical protein
MNFKKDSTITLREDAVAQFANVRASINSVTESLLIAANKSLKIQKPVYVVSVCGNWYVVAKPSLAAINGYTEVNGRRATYYIPVYG